MLSYIGFRGEFCATLAAYLFAILSHVTRDTNRDPRKHKWLTVHMRDEGDSTLVFAGRTSMVKELLVLKEKIVKHQDRVQSKILVAKVTLQENIRVGGCVEWIIANVHLHHMVAKKAKGFVEQYWEFLKTLAKIITDQRVQILVGDFNLALWHLVSDMATQHINMRLVAADVFRTRTGLRCDTLGIYALSKVDAVRRLFQASVFAEDTRRRGV